ncbi:Cell division protein FtsL [Austwickia sp. TVS 96-490-7B]|uniref:hypothetical protein n=1 Tax=Austwickia sp. TVS 96-490-7B TaxID=2830843 RepID=UPI001C563E65|nr:hypothetical protein [Austwickia sp. TVS 96-490-7B]MBW3084410.1 Cell division protein FtsL [Austwickia sp. TVS 96-490-7B]
MSQNAAARVGARRTAPMPRQPVPTPRPRLRLVPPLATQRSNFPFLLICSFALTAGLLGVLLLNMFLSQGSYEIDRLQKESALITDREAQLREELDAASSPARLAREAGKMGMVPGSSVIFLDLDTGKVKGVPATGAPSKPIRVVDDTGAATDTQSVPSPGANPQRSPSAPADSAPQR